MFSKRTQPGVPTRTHSPDDSKDLDHLGTTYLIESKTDPQYSCSFIEFDGLGDYLLFEQHQQWKYLAKLCEDQFVFLVLYCHGWKNNAQSGDVLRFNSFLSRLSKSNEIRSKGLRVHGVYLSWRGNVVAPQVPLNDSNQFYEETLRDFGKPIVDKNLIRKRGFPFSIPETLAYFNRKKGAEHFVSGVPMARSIWAYADLVKKSKKTGWGSRVAVIGHSFGALMLEQTLSQSIVGTLSAKWPWFGESEIENAIDALPFDMLLFVNSAAPSIYAKAMRDFLVAHRSALDHANMPGSAVPTIISLTSRNDKATKMAHAVANSLSKFKPRLQRIYKRFVLTPDASVKHTPVHQSEFYRRTPGHNPLLLNRWINRDRSGVEPPEGAAEDLVSWNFENYTSLSQPFFTKENGASKADAWQIGTAPEDPAELKFRGDVVEPFDNSNYWIMRCDPEIIDGHGGVWSDPAMQTYAALFAVSEAMKKPPKPPEE